MRGWILAVGSRSRGPNRRGTRDLISRVRSRSDGSDVARAREGGTSRRSWSFRGGARIELAGARLTGVPGADLAGYRVRRHQRDMGNPLGVPARVCGGKQGAQRWFF